MNEWAQLISTLGFPIISAVALFFGCRFLLEQQQKNVDRMFDMYDKSNSENRDALKAVTEAVNRLSDKLDELR
jgi:heterodisulfide reductase subunit B